MTQIFMGADHRGIILKEKIRLYLDQKSYLVFDCGTHAGEPVDYPDVARSVCEKIKNDPQARGILICGSGVGISMAANRYPYIRAAKCANGLEVAYARRHNNANVLCLGERFLGDLIAYDCVDIFLNTEFEGGRHRQRIQKLESL